MKCNRSNQSGRHHYADPRTPGGLRAYLGLFRQAILFASGFVSVKTAAKALRLRPTEVSAIFKPLTPGKPDTFIPWTQYTPALASAWAAVEADVEHRGVLSHVA